MKPILNTLHYVILVPYFLGHNLKQAFHFTYLDIQMEYQHRKNRG